MTQDAPLDQAMLAAIPEDVRKLADEARIRVLGPAFVHIGFNDAIRKAAEFAVMADRSALSRRVPASGGELTRYAMETLTGGTIPLPVVRDYGEWVKFSDLAASPIVAAPEGGSFQQRVAPWMLACFGPLIASDRLERGDRLLEEVLELLQSGDYPRGRVAALTDYVFGRDKGEPHQEAGGVMVTLAAYCLAHDLDMHQAGEDELARINTPKTIAKIRAKQAAKPTGSALPVAAAPSIPEGKAEPVAWVTPETLADLLNNAPWAAGAIGELSQRKKDNYTAPLFAAPPAPEGKAEPGEVTDAMVEAAEAAVYPRHERGFLVKPLIDPIDMRAALEAALSTPVRHE